METAHITAQTKAQGLAALFLFGFSLPNFTVVIHIIPFPEAYISFFQYMIKRRQGMTNIFL